METLTTAFGRCSEYLFWTSLGALLVVAMCVREPSPEAFLAPIAWVLVGVASSLFGRSEA